MTRTDECSVHTNSESCDSDCPFQRYDFENWFYLNYYMTTIKM